MAGQQPRLLVFDIEASNLVADFGTVFCVSWLWVGEDKVHTLSITDYPTFLKQQWNDKALVRDFARVVDDADLLIHWYGDRFDIPFLNTRLMYHGLPPMKKVPSWDGWRVARYKLKMSSNRLDTVTKFFGLGRKTPLDGQIWVKARCGHRPSIKYVVDHCKADVTALRDAYLRLRPLTNKHPHVGLMSDRPDGCPTCGSRRIRSRGWRTCETTRYRWFRCLECGSQCKGKAERVKDEKGNRAALQYRPS